MSVIPILGYSVFCVLGLVQFKIFRGTVHYWKMDLTLVDILSDPYGWRFLLVSPLFKLSEWLGISYNRLFSITIPFLIYLVTYFLSESVRSLYRQASAETRAIVFIGISLFFISLSLFMNGRLMFAFTGSSILIWSLLNWNNNRHMYNLLAVMVAILLSSVSQGTFLVTVASFYFFLAVGIATANPSVCCRKVLFSYSMLLALLTPYLMIIIKNLLAIFGGGTSAIETMLFHGYGAKLLQSNFAMLVVGIVIISLLGYRYQHLILRYWILASMSFFSLAGGMFGISTALTILPPLVVAVSIATLKFVAWFERRNLKTVVKQ